MTSTDTPTAPPGAGRSGTTGTQAVDRACALLALVVRADEPLTFTELSDVAGLARSTTSRLLAALERTDLLQRDDAGAFVAGSLFALHAARRDPWQELARVAEPFLHRLRDLTGETAHLAVPRWGSVLHVSQADSTYLLATRDWSDVQVPPHCSALGKVFYAAGALPFPDEPLEQCTEHSCSDVAALRREVDRVLRRGFAVAIDELEVGLAAVASPVSGRDGEVIAALGVSGATARLEERVDEVGRLLVEESGSLSALLSRKKTKEGAQ